MPCRVDFKEEDNDYNERMRELALIEATLCGVLRVIQHALGPASPEDNINAVFDRVDWKEAGVRREEAELWWKEHQAKDAARHAQEEADRRQQLLRNKALNKLTPEEKAALGLQ